MAKNEVNDQLLVRRQKLEELKEMGIEPFGRKYDREALARDLDEKYGSFDKDELNADMPKTKVAGRMMAKRGKGKVGFADLYDRSGKIQIYVRKDIVGEDNYQFSRRLTWATSWALKVKSSRLIQASCQCAPST